MTAEQLMQEIRGYLALNEKQRAVVEAAVRVTKARRVFAYAMATDGDADELRFAEREADEAVEAMQAAREKP